MPVGNKQQQLPGFGQLARAAMRSDHRRPEPVRFDAALRRGLKRRRRFGDSPAKPAKLAPPDPGDVLQRLASFAVIRQQRVASGELDPTKLFHIGAFKNMLCVFEAIRRAAATQGGAYCDLTEAQLIAMLAHMKPGWAQPKGVDAAERAQNRRDQHITSVRRWRDWMQDAGWLSYEVITDLSDEQLPLYTRYWIHPAPSLLTFTDELLERCFAQMQRWVARHGQDLDTGARYAVPDFWVRARPETKTVQAMKAIARGRARALRLRDHGSSKTVLAPPSGGGQDHNDLTTTATNRRTHTRLTPHQSPANLAAQEPFNNPKNSGIDNGAAAQHPDSRQHQPPRPLLEAQRQAQRERGERSTGFAYWQADLTFDLEAYNKAVLAWALSGRQGTPPHPGKALLSGPAPDGGYQQALRIHEQLLADSPPPAPVADQGPYDRPDGSFDPDAYRSAVENWAYDGSPGLPPHPGYRARARRRDPAWHQAIERYSEMTARLTDHQVLGDRGLGALEATARVLAGRLLTAATERDLRAFWVTHRWGAGDVDTRDLYGAGPELTATDRDKIAHAEASYLAHLAGQDGWPTTAVEALARVAQDHRRGQLPPIDPEYPVGAMRLLMDGVRRLAQEARRARNRDRTWATRMARTKRAGRRQRRGDHHRATPQRLSYRTGPLPPGQEPDYVTNPDAAFVWQLANLPKEILTDIEGLPVFDDHGRFVMSPMYRPHSTSDTHAIKRAAATRAKWRPVYLRLGLPLPPEHDGALYQALKAVGRLPPPPDEPLPGPEFLPGDTSLYHLRNYTIGREHGLFDHGRAYTVLLMARLEELNPTDK